MRCEKKAQRQIVFEDPLLASNDSLLYTEASVISRVYDNSFIENPIYGLAGIQASAYCSWLQKKINSELNIQGIDLTAKVTLPNTNDIIGINTKNNFTKSITNSRPLESNCTGVFRPLAG